MRHSFSGLSIMSMCFTPNSPNASTAAQTTAGVEHDIGFERRLRPVRIGAENPERTLRAQRMSRVIRSCQAAASDGHDRKAGVQASA